MRVVVLVVLLVLLALWLVPPAWGQETITAGRARVTERAVIGGATIPTSGVLRLIGVPTRTAGQAVLSVNGSGDVTGGTLVGADLPATIAYENEPNTFTGGPQIIRGAVSETASGADEIRLGVLGGTPRIILEDSGATQWLLDNTGGALRVFTPGLERFAFTAAAFGPGQGQGYSKDLGSFLNKWRSIYGAELRLETLIAADVRSTVGGKLITADTTELTADLAAAATTISVKHNSLASGDRLWLEGNGQVEFMAATSGPSGAGPYTYTVTRNLDLTGADTWPAGAAVVSTGTTGDGFIEQYATRSLGGLIGPTIRGMVRTGTAYDALAARWAVGNLDGMYGYVATTFGAAFGDPAAANVTIDPANGVRIRYGASNRLVADAAGNLSLVSGAVSIDTLGMEIDAVTSYDDTRSYRFSGGTGTGQFGLYGRAATSGRYLALQSISTVSSGQGRIEVTAGDGTNTSAITLIGGTAGGVPAGAIAIQSLAHMDLLGNGFIRFGHWSPGAGTELGISTSNSTTNPGFPWIRGDGNYLILNGDGPIYFNWDNTSQPVISGGSYFQANHIYPLATNTYGLGQAGLKWAHLYLTDTFTTAALFPIVSNSGHVEAKSNGLNGTSSCPGGVKTITTQYGIVTAVTC